MTNRSLLWALCASALAALGAVAHPAVAQVRTAEDVVQVRLLDGWRTDRGTHMSAIQITLAPGWKTYWRAPGEGGIPPRLRLDGTTGVDSFQIHWPRPEVFFINGMRSIGYRRDVILPLELALSSSGPVEIDGRIELGVCQDICIPVSLDIAVLLSVRTGRDPLIVAALSERAMTASEAGAGSATCTITPISDGLRVQVQMAVPPTGSDEAVVMELPDPGIWISEASSSRSGNMVTATADVVPADVGPFAMDRSTLTITVIGSESAVELQGCSG